MEDRKKLPIGEEFFRNIRTKGFYYVDKTEFIGDLLRTRGSVNLFTRPRRFGKSLNMDMLKSFFEIGADFSLFEGLKIAEEKELCEQHMGKYPVISISLKDVGGEDYQTAYDMMCMIISEEATKYDFLLESDKLMQYDREKFGCLVENRFERPTELYGSLKLLTRLLCKHYGTPVIVLIDEYDVPLDKAYQNGYYSQMVNLIRSLFGQVLKTNGNLEFAVITGCLRINMDAPLSLGSKTPRQVSEVGLPARLENTSPGIHSQSIFTGLNNFKVRTISDVECAEYFGFTDCEVKEMLQYYGLEEKFELFKEWYDGYRFGNTDVYCPWDVLNQCDKFRESKNAQMEPHWENRSGNAIVKDIIKEATEVTRAEIETLISGDYVEKPIIAELTYTDLDSEDENLRQTYLWSVLYATGYLTDFAEPVGKIHKLVIPNKEVLGIYQDRIYSWFRVRVT